MGSMSLHHHPNRRRAKPIKKGPMSPAPLAEVCDVTTFGPANPKGHLLVEVPHGATRLSDYEGTRRHLTGELPKDLEHFFCVNTDIGAPEGALYLGDALGRQGFAVTVLRCLIPRTFIDTNRVLARTTQGVVVDGLTPGVPGYVTSKDDIAWLEAQAARYHARVGEAYRAVCGEAKGLAVQLHSYAPKSVGIEKTDADIVNALHRAYEPAVYATWPERPQIDFISATADGSFQSAPALVTALREALVAAGFDARENATYHLHPATMGLEYALAWRDRVVCFELNRGLVADPFVPFGVSPISAEKVARVMAPLLPVLAHALTGDSI
jgi:hypothetical protein